MCVHHATGAFARNFVADFDHSASFDSNVGDATILQLCMLDDECAHTETPNDAMVLCVSAPNDEARATTARARGGATTSLASPTRTRS